MGQPLLGLTKEAFEGLGLRTDFIVHVAAEVNMVKPPQALAASNVTWQGLQPSNWSPL